MCAHSEKEWLERFACYLEMDLLHYEEVWLEYHVRACLEDHMRWMGGTPQLETLAILKGVWVKDDQQ